MLALAPVATMLKPHDSNDCAVVAPDPSDNDVLLAPVPQLNAIPYQYPDPDIVRLEFPVVVIDADVFRSALVGGDFVLSAQYVKHGVASAPGEVSVLAVDCVSA